MKEINETFLVSAIFPCEYVQHFDSKYEHDPVWRQTAIGCIVLNLLQNIYHFKFGFVLRRYNVIQQRFYSQPFNDSVWVSIFITIFLASLTFYGLSLWDHRLFGVEYSFAHELLLAFSAYCQHILPLQAISYSRRVAYLSFILCAYVVHCFYTSNLLSHLVNDKEETMDLQSIVDDNYQIILLKDMNITQDVRKYEMSLDKNLSIVWEKVKQLVVMKLGDAMKAVINTRSALLSDYITLYPIWKRNFEAAEICQLVEIDIYSNVKNYLFTSRNFSYKEEFKIGVLRAKEVGLLKKILMLNRYSPISCTHVSAHNKVQFEHTVIPIVILLSAYLFAGLVLLGEKLHYARNRVWPYVN
ncbi:uncharacterized protein LOC123660951 [Melitaea cinxia]|uniref:uncharacterized protein LOC123660951 n=1 Tax=Melitaea cinxia TaxID=113334 RepID=UPI001E26F934|nr:uncharacterized protein LOC123660951 [Melitaea cinxia]